MVSRQTVERRVLSGLKERLLAPDLVAEFVRAYAEAAAEQRRSAERKRTALRDQLADVERHLAGVLAAMEAGAWSDALRQRLHELEQRKAGLLAVRVDAPAANVIALHPNAAALFQAKVADLESALNLSESRVEAADALRALIDRVVLTPAAAEPDGMRIALYGDLAEILALNASDRADPPPDGSAHRGASGSGVLSVVAGIGFEPMTFRL